MSRLFASFPLPAKAERFKKCGSRGGAEARREEKKAAQPFSSFFSAPPRLRVNQTFYSRFRGIDGIEG
jgi:hypothetical protein